MECSIAALIACFSWSGLYVDTGFTSMDLSTPRQEWRTFNFTNSSGVHETGGSYVNASDYAKSYGRFAVGYTLDFGSVQLSLEGSQTYGLASESVNRIRAVSVNARWYPFR